MATLNEILKTTLEKYTGEGANCLAFPLFDDLHQTYGVNMIDHPIKRYEAGMLIFARIVDEKIIIEADNTDRPLAEALVEAGIPRENIVLSYAEEAMLPR